VRCSTLLPVLERSAIGLLVVVHVMAHQLTELAERWPVAAMLLRDAVAFSQPVLLLTCLFLGPGPRPFRVACGLPTVLLFDCRAFEAAMGTGTLLIANMTVAVLCLAAVRFGGFRVVRDELGKRTRKTLRFSLRTIFMCIAISALAVRAAQALRDFAMTHEGWSSNIAFGGTGGIAVLVSIVTLWAVLSPGQPWPRILVVAGVAPLAGLLPAYLCGDDAVFWPLVALTSTEAGVTAGSLAIIRACQFRLVRVMPDTRENRAASREFSLAHVGSNAARSSARWQG
jgi:hypothetical protein